MVAGASAYEIVIDAPTSIQAGAPLVVNGTTNLADGVGISIALSNADYTTLEIEKKDLVVQRSDENKSFSVVFNTTGLKKGQSQGRSITSTRTFRSLAVQSPSAR